MSEQSDRRQRNRREAARLQALGATGGLPSMDMKGNDTADALRRMQLEVDMQGLAPPPAAAPPPPPRSNAPVGGLPPEFGGGGGGGGMAPPAGVMPSGPTPLQPEGPVVPEAPAATVPNADGTVTAPPMIPITSPWSNKAPQLQVGVANPAGPAEFDYSHLQQQPLKSAAEKFGGATETSRALRSGVGERYGGGRQYG